MDRNKRKSEDTAKLLLEQHHFEIERLERELNENSVPQNKIMVFIVIMAIIMLIMGLLAKMLGMLAK